MDQNTEKAFDEIEKALRPEVSKEQLGMVIEHLMEAIESMIEAPEENGEEEDSQEMDSEETPTIGNENGDVYAANWPMEKMDGQTDLEVENENEIYKSDNEDEDKWDNQMQKCWVGYKQVGMKDKGGKMVPNCVPVEKGHEMNETQEEVKKSLWGGAFDPVDFAKRKFSTQARQRMAESGNAMPDGSYPIGNKKDLMNAIRSWGRGGSDPKVKAHIKRRAKELGAENMIPDNWK